MSTEDFEEFTEVTIDSAEELYATLEQLGLKPASSLQSLCIALAERAIDHKQSSLTIELATDLIPASYVGVPAMFARSMASKISFAYVQSFVREGYMIVHAGDSKKPTTFRARVLADLKTKGHFIIKRKRVPK